LFVFTHASSQYDSMPPQVQEPSRQDAFDLHALSHAPQCSALVFVFTQIPHAVWPAGHAQAPATHT
jgi:hypothetical protein